jgi:hypothetical protein
MDHFVPTGTSTLVGMSRRKKIQLGALLEGSNQIQSRMMLDDADLNRWVAEKFATRQIQTQEVVYCQLGSPEPVIRFELQDKLRKIIKKQNAFASTPMSISFPF